MDCRSARLPRIILASLLFLLSLAAGAQAGGTGALDYVKKFLGHYPKFEAEGVMVSTPPSPNPPYRCRIEIHFNKGEGMKFFYNTDGAKNVIPYDYVYANRHLKETVYNRDRTQVLKKGDVGAPTSMIFNFIWDLLDEIEDGAGARSLVLNGLMSVEETENLRGAQITLKRRLPILPVEKVVFTFDRDQRLRGLQILQSDGTVHRIDIRRFRIPAPAPTGSAEGAKP